MHGSFVNNDTRAVHYRSMVTQCSRGVRTADVLLAGADPQ